MNTFKEKEYEINVCTDIFEWAKEFYDMPEGSELANADEVSSECMGFASLQDKRIWIFVSENYELKKLKETVAHEIGHIIEANHLINPPDDLESDYLHEMKANYYADFYLLVDKIVLDIINLLKTK